MTRTNPNAPEEPDREPNSQAGAASPQAAQADQKAQAEGDPEQEEPTGRDRYATPSGPSGDSTGGLSEWQQRVAEGGPERPDLPREGDTRHQPPGHAADRPDPEEEGQDEPGGFSGSGGTGSREP